MKKAIGIILALLLLIASLPGMAEEASTCVLDIQKYGNLILALTGSALLNAGFAYGDVMTVTINGVPYEMPVGSNYSDVEQGSMICRVVVKEDPAEDCILLAINMGDLATASGIATKEKTEADPGYVWHMNEGVAKRARTARASLTPSWNA